MSQVPFPPDQGLKEGSGLGVLAGAHAESVTAIMEIAIQGAERTRFNTVCMMISPRQFWSKLPKKDSIEALPAPLHRGNAVLLRSAPFSPNEKA